jgi:DoxX-like family
MGKLILNKHLNLVTMTTKSTKITYWIATVIIFLFEGVMPALTGQTKLAKEGISHLGYPEYFGTMLVVFKVLGSLAIILPKIPNRVKEWAYAGLAIELISAFISNCAIDGFSGLAMFPLIVLAVLVVSYICYNRIYKPYSSIS